MHPVLDLAVGGQFFAVSSYRVLILLAAAVTIGLALAVAARRGLPMARATTTILLMAAAVPVGARLLDAATNADLYRSEPDRLLSTDLASFSLYGGLLLALAVGLVACRLLAVDVVRLADSTAPALGMGLAVVRVGCFLAGCCFGVQTDLPWGVTYPVGSSVHLHQLLSGVGLFSGVVAPVHPTQLYEAMGGLIAAGLAGLLLYRKAVDGTAFLVSAIWFSAIRWANYYLRVQSSSFTMPTWFYPALYLGIILACGWLLLRRYAPSFVSVRPDRWASFWR